MISRDSTALRHRPRTRVGQVRIQWREGPAAGRTPKNADSVWAVLAIQTTGQNSKVRIHVNARHQRQIDELIRQGRRPAITLSPALEIVIPKRRTGRPEIRDPNARCRHYVDPRAYKHPARCLARGCNRRLRRDQRGVCSEACAHRVP